VALVQQGAGEARRELGTFRVERSSLPESGHGGVEVVLLLQGVAVTPVKPGILGAQFDSLAKDGDAFVESDDGSGEVALFPQGMAERQVEGAVLRIQGDGLTAGVDGPVEVAFG